MKLALIQKMITFVITIALTITFTSSKSEATTNGQSKAFALIQAIDNIIDNQELSDMEMTLVPKTKTA